MALLTAHKVSETLNLPLPRVYELARAGILPSVRIGRQVRFDEAALREWVARGGRTLPGGWRRSPARKETETNEGQGAPRTRVQPEGSKEAPEAGPAGEPSVSPSPARLDG